MREALAGFAKLTALYSGAVSVAILAECTAAEKSRKQRKSKTRRLHGYAVTDDHKTTSSRRQRHQKG
jgi:hypothetical protein